MENLLLHTCCAPCAIYPVKILQARFKLTLLFYGPNIHPQEEYEKRLEYVKKLDLPLIELEYDKDRWFALVKGFEREPEGGKRCRICYQMRLERVGRYAVENGYRYIGTTLTVSPHKPASVINTVGESIAREFGLIFLSEDFKKKGGFKMACQLSKEYGFYRQRYCGCEYSIKMLHGKS